MTSETTSGRRRLSQNSNFYPWVKAEATPDGSSLFWLPVANFPLTHDKGQWVQGFLSFFSTALQKQFALRSESFIRFKEIGPDLVVDFRTYMERQPRLYGLGLLPGNQLPPEANEDQRKAMAERLQAEELAGSPGRTLLWFVNKQAEAQRGLFFGYGHMTTIFLPADFKTRPPRLPLTPALRAALPVFQERDIDAEIAAQYALKDEFLAKSRQLFGTVVEARPEYRKIGFIVPQMESATFFQAPSSLRKSWFALAPVYLEESVKDKGLLLAMKEERYQAAIDTALAVMAQRGLPYPERS